MLSSPPASPAGTEHWSQLRPSLPSWCTLPSFPCLVLADHRGKHTITACKTNTTTRTEQSYWVSECRFMPVISIPDTSHLHGKLVVDSSLATRTHQARAHYIATSSFMWLSHILLKTEITISMTILTVYRGQNSFPKVHNTSTKWS